jgi:AcrR family transcriptional regulator
MGRRPGSRNKQFEEKRSALLDRLTPNLMSQHGDPATLKELAEAAAVSPPTLRHYFDDLEGVYEAVLTHNLEQGAPFLERYTDPGERDARDALWAFVASFFEGWEAPLGKVFTSTLRLGLAHPERGPRFLDCMLEPSLQACEQLITRLVDLGRLPEVEPRGLALSLVSPVLLAMLHQHELGGACARALDVEAFARRHLDLVLAGLGAARAEAQRA